MDRERLSPDQRGIPITWNEENKVQIRGRRVDNFKALGKRTRDPEPIR